MPEDALDVLRLVPADALAVAHDSVVRPLAEYEHVAGGDLVLTLRTYVASGGNALATASQLGTHRNTILNRLMRINQLLGVDVRQPETLYRVYGALRAGELLQQHAS